MRRIKKKKNVCPTKMQPTGKLFEMQYLERSVSSGYVYSINDWKLSNSILKKKK